MTLQTVYILYNAKASVWGKLDYALRKVTAPADSPPCSACDLTHGGLYLSETAAWRKTKTRINAQVEQLHKDELSGELAEFVKTSNIQYPSVLGQTQGGKLKLLIDAKSLQPVSKDHDAFVALLVQAADKEGIPLTLSDETATSTSTKL